MKKEYCNVSGCLLDLLETDSEVEIFNMLKKEIAALKKQNEILTQAIIKMVFKE